MLLAVGCKVCLYLSKLLGAQGNSWGSAPRICTAYSWLTVGDSCSQSGSHCSPSLLQQGRRLLEGEFWGLSAGKCFVWLLPGAEWQTTNIWFQNLVTSLSSGP